MTEVGDFEFKGNVYVILAFQLPAAIGFLMSLSRSQPGLVNSRVQTGLKIPLNLPLQRETFYSPL